MRDYLSHALHDCGRLELRHATGDRWVSGIFDDIGAMRQEIQRRAGQGNLYCTVNAPLVIHAGNAMTDRALTDADIAHHTRLVFDFDPVRPKDTPSTDAELHAALDARDRLVGTLLSLGWPMPAIAVSGNGAHALFRWRLPVTTESKDMLSVLYKGLAGDFGTDVVKFDTSVRNPGRIWRLYGTQNRKGTPTPTRPHRTATVTIPARWEALSPRQVGQLASSYARKPAPMQSTSMTGPAVRGLGDYSTLDVVGWFKAHASYRRHLGQTMHAVACPWGHEHSTEDGADSTATVVWEASGRCWPNFRCLHDHCDGRGIRDVLALWGDADRFCGRRWERAA